MAIILLSCAIKTDIQSSPHSGFSGPLATVYKIVISGMYT